MTRRLTYVARVAIAPRLPKGPVATPAAALVPNALVSRLCQHVLRCMHPKGTAIAARPSLPKASACKCSVPHILWKPVLQITGLPSN